MTWLRSNQWYFVALAVLVPAAILAALNAGYFGYVEGRDGRPIAVDGSDSVDYAGATWSMLEWHSFDATTDAGQTAGLLEGTSLITATIGVRPDSVGPGCTVELVDAAGDRQWDTAQYGLADFETDAGAEDFCSSTTEDPYRLQVHFVVPDDAVEGAQLRLWSPDALPAFLLFEL